MLFLLSQGNVCVSINHLKVEEAAGAVLVAAVPCCQGALMAVQAAGAGPLSLVAAWVVGEACQGEVACQASGVRALSLEEHWTTCDAGACSEEVVVDLWGVGAY